MLRIVTVLTRRHAKEGAAIQSTTPSLVISLPHVPCLFSPDSLDARLLTLTDRRDPRGIRYPLAVLLTSATPAKLAEQGAPQESADWARLRAPTLADLFGLDRPTMPHPTTWNRVFGAAIVPVQFRRLVAAFLVAATAPLARNPQAATGDGRSLSGWQDVARHDLGGEDARGASLGRLLA